MRSLVTGGCGFIGSHLVEHLLAATDDEVVVLDGLTYAGDATRLASLDGYDPKRCRIVWHDLRAEVPMSTAERIGTVDRAFHLAAMSSVDRSITDPEDTIIGNNAITAYFYRYMRTYQDRVEAIVHVSTDEVYGPAPPGRMNVEWDPILPSNAYSASKAGCEASAFAYWRTHGLPIAIVNIMNVIGRRQLPEKFMPRTIAAIKAGVPVTIHARPYADKAPQKRLVKDEGGRWWEPSSRVWIHADDVAAALTFITDNLGARRYTPDAERPDRWHIAGDSEVDVATMAHWIGLDLGIVPRLRFEDYHSSRPGHDHRYALDASALRAEGWRPSLTTREAVRAVVEWESRTASSESSPYTGTNAGPS
jgi:dTDP-glucose 4,6-dehydratase